MSTTGGRHARQSRRDRRPSLVRRMSAAALAAGAAVLLAMLASGGTYATLNSSATTGGAVIQSGTATLSAAAVGLTTTKLYPGAAVSGSSLVENTGTVPLRVQLSALTLTSTASAFSGAVTVGVSTTTAGGTCPAVSTTWQGTFASASAVDLVTRLAPQSTVLVCVSVSLPASAPAAAAGGAALSFTLQLDGRQVA